MQHHMICIDLVHIAMQNWLKLKGDFGSWSETTLYRVTNAFPWPQHENRGDDVDVWMMFLPHEFAISAFNGSFGKNVTCRRRPFEELSGHLKNIN